MNISVTHRTGNNNKMKKKTVLRWQLHECNITYNGFNWLITQFYMYNVYVV